MHQGDPPSSPVQQTPLLTQRKAPRKVAKANNSQATYLSWIESPSLPGAGCPRPQSQRRALCVVSSWPPLPNLPAAATAPAAELRAWSHPPPDHHISREWRGERNLIQLRGQTSRNYARRTLPFRVAGLFSINAFTVATALDCGPKVRIQREFLCRASFLQKLPCHSGCMDSPIRLCGFPTLFIFLISIVHFAQFESRSFLLR